MLDATERQGRVINFMIRRDINIMRKGEIDCLTVSAPKIKIVSQHSESLIERREFFTVSAQKLQTVSTQPDTATDEKFNLERRTRSIFYTIQKIKCVCRLDKMCINPPQGGVPPRAWVYRNQYRNACRASNLNEP